MKTINAVEGKVTQVDTISVKGERPPSLSRSALAGCDLTLQTPYALNTLHRDPVVCQCSPVT